MNITQKNIINKICAILVIFALTMSDFLLIGKSAISYALDETKTNNENIEFSTYFEDANGEKQEKIEGAIDSIQNLTVEIAVKNEGYFNGSIKLQDSNFKFVTENETYEGVQSVGEDEIKLNQINAGSTRKISLKIMAKNNDKINEMDLSKVSTVELNGDYINSKNVEKEKSIEIKGTTNIEVDWKSSEQANLELESKLLTNSIYNINGDSKKIVQILVNNKITNNSYPVQNTEIKLSVPENVQDVNVFARSTDATNSELDFSDANYEYNKDEKILTIKISNEDKNNISWIKNVKDTFIVTYVLDKNDNINNQDVAIDANSILYDGKQLTSNQNVHIEEEIDGVISGSIESSENEIFKGKIYAGEEREYHVTDKVNVDYLDIIDNINVKEQETKYLENDAEKPANIIYKETKINKDEFLKIFGNEGYITIKNSNGVILANINKDSQADENGKITISYPDGEKSIEFDTSKPVEMGTLNIENTKSILNLDYSRTDIEKLTGIKEKLEINGKEIENTISLKETESVADIKMDVTKLSTVAEKQTITLEGTLQANDESKDLYKNPTVTLKFPKEIEVKSAAYAALYKNGLEIESANSEKNANGETEISIKFTGEQTKYDISGGTKILLKVDVSTDKLTPSKASSVEMKYTNQNKGIEKTANAEVDFESQYGLMIYNQIANYNNNNDSLYTVDKEVAYGELDANAQSKDIKLNTALINNYGEKISNVSLVGKIPAENNEESFVTKLHSLEINNDKVKIYYSTKTDISSDDESWGEYSEDAKSYKLAIDEMESQETIKFNVPITIPENLKYNQKGTLSSNVSCEYQGKNETNNSGIVLATKASMASSTTEKVETQETENGLSTQISTFVGNGSLSENDTVYEGQTIRYKVTITNNTGKDYSNVEVKANQQNAYVWDTVEKEMYNPYYNNTSKEHFYEATENNEITLGKIENLKNGDSVVYEYQAKTYELNNTKIDGNDTYGTISIVSEDNELNETATTIKNKIQSAELQVDIVGLSSDEAVTTSGSAIKACLEIKNVTDQEQKDIDVTLVFSSNLTADITIANMYEDVVTYKGEETKENMQHIELKISSIAAGGKIEIALNPYTDYTLGDSKEANTWILAEAISESKNSYISNKFTRKVEDHSKDIKITQQVRYEDGKDFNTETGKLNNGDKVEFITTVKNNESTDQNVELEYNLDKMIEIESAKLITSSGEEDVLSEMSYNNLQKDSQQIKAGETIQISVTGTIDTLEIDSLTNKLTITDRENQRITDNNLEIAVNRTEDEPTEPSNPDQDDNNNNNNNSGNNNNDQNNSSSDNNQNDSNINDEDKNTYTISGTAWIDKDKDGKRTSEDETKPEIEVIAMDADKGEVRDTTKTDANGTYKFELQEGNYIIVFKYDTNIYTTTTYQLNGVSEEENSDAITREITIDENSITAGTTDIIKLNKNVSGIDIGLAIKNTFDLKIKKYVSKITVTNDSKTTTYNQKDNTTLAKAEIKAKNLSDSLVVVEYKIKVTNEGQVAGYARNIVDYMPKTLSFNSNLNSDWYISGENLYNTSLANTKIEPGETKELTLILTKQMTDSNTGLVNNKAEITETSNELGARNESNDKGSADVIISVSTGTLVNYVATTVITLIILAGLAFFINKKYLSKKI